MGHRPRDEVHHRHRLKEPDTRLWCREPGNAVMVILEKPAGAGIRAASDARPKSEASLRRHTFVRYPTRVRKYERLSLTVARLPTSQKCKDKSCPIKVARKSSCLPLTKDMKEGSPAAIWGRIKRPNGPGRIRGQSGCIRRLSVSWLSPSSQQV